MYSREALMESADTIPTPSEEPEQSSNELVMKHLIDLGKWKKGVMGFVVMSLILQACTGATGIGPAGVVAVEAAPSAVWDSGTEVGFSTLPAPTEFPTVVEPTFTPIIQTKTPDATKTPSPTLTPTSSPSPSETPDHRFGRTKITDEEYYELINTISKTSCLGKWFFDFIEKQTTDPERVGHKLIPIEFQKNCAGVSSMLEIEQLACIPYFIPDPDKYPNIPSKAIIYLDWSQTDCDLAGWSYDDREGGIYPIYP